VIAVVVLLLLWRICPPTVLYWPFEADARSFSVRLMEIESAVSGAGFCLSLIASSL
jgi:hypothetical protein